MRREPLAGLVLAVAVLAGCGSRRASGPVRIYQAACSDSTYTQPAKTPLSTAEALRLGPVVFNDLPPGQDVVRPSRQFPYYAVPTFLDVLTSARRGVTITVSSRSGRIALAYPEDLWARLASGKATLADGARGVHFPVCRNPSTSAPLITQYGASIYLPAPGCFTLRVQPVGSRRSYAATIRALVAHC